MSTIIIEFLLGVKQEGEASLSFSVSLSLSLTHTHTCTSEQPLDHTETRRQYAPLRRGCMSDLCSLSWLVLSNLNPVCSYQEFPDLAAHDHY